MTNNSPDTWPTLDIAPLVKRLRRYNEWRRGADFAQPSPSEIGTDIDAAADLLEKMAQAIIDTLDNNLHLADGDDCTLIDLVRLACGK